MTKHRLHAASGDVPRTPIGKTTSGLILICSALLLGGQDSSRSVTADDPRPLAKVIDTLERRHGWIITYEDPRFQHEQDVEDVTAAVGNMRSKQRILIPKGLPFTFTYNAPTEEEGTLDSRTTILSLLATYGTTGNPGQFDLISTGDIHHVVPQAIRARDGGLQQQPSILDVLVTMAAQERTAEEAITFALRQVADQTGIPVLLGTVPHNLLLQTKVETAVFEQSARQVLLKILSATGQRISWQLFFDPGLSVYVFNARILPVNGFADIN